MEHLNLMTGNYIFAIVVFLLFLILVLLVLLINTNSRLKKLQEKYDFFTQGKDVDIDTLLTDTLSELRQAKSDINDLDKRSREMREQMRGCLQRVKVKRYDAFDAMGGEMSYSILLADENNDGIILTSIYGRQESRSYAKAIKGGKSSHQLADEEKELL